MKKQHWLCIFILTICTLTFWRTSASASSVKKIPLCIDCVQHVSTSLNGHVKWKSSNKAVASVSNGYITGKKVGNAVIKATNGKITQKWKVTVKRTIKQGDCGKYGDNAKWKLSKDGTLFITGVGITASYLKYGSIAPFFSVRSMITRVIVSEGIKAIGAGTFSDCINLKSVTLPASLENIGKKAFSGCKKLTTLYIEPTIKKIYSSAFSGCNKLKNVLLGNKKISIDRFILSFSKKLRSNASSLWKHLMQN